MGTMALERRTMVTDMGRRREFGSAIQGGISAWGAGKTQTLEMWAQRQTQTAGRKEAQGQMIPRVS